MLNIKVEGNRVRIFTHTLERLVLPYGTRAYGCTEFVLRFESNEIRRGDLASVEARISRILTAGHPS